MKYVDEFRSPQGVDYFRQSIAKHTTRPWTLMEVCGSQTNTIVKYGLENLLPDAIELVHGPGCPVCVTPAEILDQAIALALNPGIILCSFGDMLRVPGTKDSLLQARALGGDVRTVYSPMDALQIARDNPEHQVVFLAIGFETTAPLNAMAIIQAAKEQCNNFSVLVSQVTVPPAILAILSNPKQNIDGFLAAGHVCTIMGEEQYQAIANQFHIPIVITGFEPLDLMAGIDRCVIMLEHEQYGAVNCYKRSVKPQGNPNAQAILKEVFELVDKDWRGIGIIPNSGLALRQEYKQFDAALRFPLQKTKSKSDNRCISGEILQGLKKPKQCPYFGKQCHSDHPLGATMVSSEGACAAYFNYQLLEKEPTSA
jgi:hydrogenase expression/formation protein HypD